MNLSALPSLIFQTLGWIYRTIQIKRDPVGYARSIGVEVGTGARLLGIHGGTFGSEPYLIRLGNDVTVTSGVQFITHDGGIAVIRKHLGHASIFGPIVVGNNVFIGYGSILLPNIRIGDNVLIAAGAVVTRDLPSGVVAAGVPARPIKTVEEYAKTVSAHAVLIEHLSPDQKRQFLLERYRPTQSAPAGREERR